MNKIDSATLGQIGRSKKNKNPVFRVPGFPTNLYWYEASPPVGTKMSVADLLAWIDDHQITLFNRHLIDPAAAEAKRVRDREKLHEYWRHIVPTEKQLAYLSILKYQGAPPQSKADARDLIAAILKTLDACGHVDDQSSHLSNDISSTQQLNKEIGNGRL